MSEAETTEELCHCGRPLHYSDPVVEAFTRDLIRANGPTVKVNVGARTWEVDRHYIALHGLAAADLPELGFPEVEVAKDSPASQEGLGLGPDEVLEPPPGPLEGDESDEALMMYQEAAEALRPVTDPSEPIPARSPMRSALEPQSKHGRLSAALNRAGDQRFTASPADTTLDLVKAIAEFLLES
jgi:hypothetical protein